MSEEKWSMTWDEIEHIRAAAQLELQQYEVRKFDGGKIYCSKKKPTAALQLAIHVLSLIEVIEHTYSIMTGQQLEEFRKAYAEERAAKAAK